MEKSDRGAGVQSVTSVPGRQSKSAAPKDWAQEEVGNPPQAKNNKNAPGQQSESAVLKDSAQEEVGNPSQAENKQQIGSGVEHRSGIHQKMSNPAAGASGSADTGNTRSASGDNTKDNVPSSATNDTNANKSAVKSSTSRQQIQYYDLLRSIRQENHEVIRSMALVGDSNILLTGSDNQIVRRWHKGEKLAQFDSARLHRGRGPVYAIDLHRPHSQSTAISIFLAHNAGEIGVWVASDIDFVPMLVWTLQTPSDQIKSLVGIRRDPLANRINCMCVSEERDIVYTGSADCHLRVWKTAMYHSNPVETICAHKGSITALTVGRQLVFSGSSDGVIQMWKRNTNSTPNVKVEHNLVAMAFVQREDKRIPAAITALAFQKVGEAYSGYLYAGCSDGKVRCWMNAPVGEPEILTFHNAEVTCLALCSGPLVFSGSLDRTICVWRMYPVVSWQIGKAYHRIATSLEGHSKPITCIKVEDDWDATDAAPRHRRWIVYSGSLDQTLKIWRVYEWPETVTVVDRRSA